MGRSEAFLNSLVMARVMSLTELDSYKWKGIASYREKLLLTGKYNEKEALQLAEDTFSSLLPSRTNTEDKRIYIMQNELNTDIGLLWYCFGEITTGRIAFICDLTVYEEFRRRGYGRAILRYAEKETKCYGVNQIGLNVYKSNSGATSLYLSEGYRMQEEAPESMYMMKHL
jgi:ribosomal protein S18 acetylase RimI-like enzyme